MIITIDGPSGTGKTTTAKRVAADLKMTYLDTGAMYRSFAWYLLNQRIPIQEENLSQDVFERFEFRVEVVDNEKHYYVNGDDITNAIRSTEVTQASSLVAQFASVRHHIVRLQREFAEDRDVVVEGRDIGSVVFPHAQLKIFLEADPVIRAERRYKEICEKYPEQAKQTSVEEILRQQAQRDQNDRSRKISPLICPNDAKRVNTSRLTIDQVVKKIIQYAERISDHTTWFQRVRYRIIRSIVGLFICSFYSIRVLGKENMPKGSAILASNHVSFLDPPIIAVAASGELHFLARATLFKHFIFGKLIASLNAHPIAGGVNDVALFQIVEKLILQGKKVVMFPEGKRSRDGNLQPFKRGLGWIVARTQAPVVPILIQGAYEAWPRRKKTPSLFKSITCVFGKPMYFSRTGNTTEKEYQDMIAQAVFEKIQELSIWTKQGRKGPLP